MNRLPRVIHKTHLPFPQRWQKGYTKWKRDKETNLEEKNRKQNSEKRFLLCHQQPFQDMSFPNYKNVSHLFTPSAWNALVCSFRRPQHLALMGWFRQVGAPGFTLQHAQWASWSIPWAGENRFFITLSWIITGIPGNKEGGKCPATGHHGPLSPKWPLVEMRL